MSANTTDSSKVDIERLDDSQKRRLRALRKTFRAEKIQIKDDGWAIEVSFMDGSKARVNSKLLKLKEQELQADS